MAPLRKQISRKQYSEETIKRCLQVIASGKTVYAGCKQFGIPMSTIRYRMSGLWKEKYKPGPESVLTKSEEQKIIRWLGDMQDRGFPVSRRTLRFKVSEFLSSDPSRITPFRNNQPGKLSLFIRGTWFRFCGHVSRWMFWTSVLVLPDSGDRN